MYSEDAYGLLFETPDGYGGVLVVLWAFKLCGGGRLAAQGEPAVKHQQRVRFGTRELNNDR
jgi:hypothetical protein